MLGQKLYNLILELNTSERKLLFYIAKRSDDKRHKQFVLLLGSKQQSAADFQHNLSLIKTQLSSKSHSEKEKNDFLRRFIDFCIKEIEDLKIEHFTKSHPEIRHYILSAAYNKVNTKAIYQDYLSKLGTYTKEENDYWLRSYFLTKMANIKLLNQTEDDFQDWRQLVSQQINLLQDFYQKEISNVYEKIASSFVDDKNSLSHFNADYLKEDYIVKQMELAKSPKVKATFYLALSRFNIDDEVKYPIYSSEAIRLIKNTPDLEADFIRRKVFFASFLHTFHFSHSYTVIKKLLTKILVLNEKNNTIEPKIYFYLFLLQIINDDKDGEVNVYTDNNVRKYFSDEGSLYFYNFLEALEYFKSHDYKNAKRIISNLSFINNPYIASWSRCLEIVINYNQKNFDLTDNLIKKEIKRLINQTNRFFTINSSIVLIVKMSKLLDNKTPKLFQDIYLKTTKLSPIHQFIIDSLNKH